MSIRSRWQGTVASLGIAEALVLVGCSQDDSSGTAGPAPTGTGTGTMKRLEEKTGEALDAAGKKLGEVKDKAAEVGSKAVDATGRAVERTGEAVAKGDRGIPRIAADLGVGSGTVQRVKAALSIAT